LKGLKPNPLRTFAQAKADHLANLAAHGWRVVTHQLGRPLKVPHATSPDGRAILWFKPQAVYLGSHSLFFDLRTGSTEQLLARVAQSLHHGWQAQGRPNPLPIALLPAAASGIAGGAAWEGTKHVARRVRSNPFDPLSIAAEGLLAGAAFGVTSTLTKHAVKSRLANPYPRRRGPSQAQWMAAYQDAFQALHPGQRISIKWDELLYPFQQGWDPVETARKHAARKPNPFPYILAVGNVGRGPRPGRRVNPSSQAPFQVRLPADKVLGLMPVEEVYRRWPQAAAANEAALRDFNHGGRVAPEAIIYDDGSPEYTVGWIGGRSPEITYGGPAGVAEGGLKRGDGFTPGQDDETTWVHKSKNTYLVGVTDPREAGKKHPTTRDFRFVGSMIARKRWLRK
jgi:hypothetical protein